MLKPSTFNMGGSHGARLLLVVALCFVVAGCSEDNKAQQQMGPQAMPVGVVTLTAQSVLTSVELTGRVASHATAEVRPQVSGIILKRLFEEGSNVKAGDQLYQIDPAMYQAQYDTAAAALQKAQTSLANNKSIVDRYTEIIKVKGVSQQEYDNSRAQYRASEADVSSAVAAVKTAGINLNYTKVFSPVSGRVGISSVTEGALVTAQQAVPLVYVQQMDPMYIDITQSSADFLRLQRNMMRGTMAEAGENSIGVKLTLEDGQPYEHEAKMLLYDATVSKSTGSITLRATVKNPDNLLLPGMFVRARVIEGVTENALLVPLQCVQRTPKGEAMVLVVGKDGTVEQRIIESNRIYDNSAWIVLPGVKDGKGLDAGEQVIVEGLNRVRAGGKAMPYPHGAKPEAPAQG